MYCKLAVFFQKYIFKLGFKRSILDLQLLVRFIALHNICLLDILFPKQGALMKKQKTQYVILGLLSMEPLSGYEIQKLIHQSIGHFWSESNGQLYPALNQLLDNKLILLDRIEQKKKKVRHIYSITDEGRVALEGWLQEKTEGKSNHRDEDLFKLFFGKNCSTQVCLDLLLCRQKRVQNKLEEFTAIQNEITMCSSSPHYQFWSFALKNGLYQAEAELRWCKECIKELS
jgi:PadR family transcriptional regulator, regulatory protein AphA